MGTPREPVTLKWHTVTAARMRRDYLGGTAEFTFGGRIWLGGRWGAVADKAWARASEYFGGTNSNPYRALANYQGAPIGPS
jgi:hypothetical protein